MPVIRSTTTRRRALGLALAGLSAASLSFAQATAPPYVGVNAGAPISGTSILFTDAVAADIAASGCRFVRINFIGAASGWDTARLALYDQIIANAVNNDLQVLAVFSNETVWGFSQAQWNENYNTTGLNAYTTAYAQTAYLLINRYKDDVKLFELWNEPSCWAVDPVTNPLNPGCSYIWPRIFANLLVETYKECIDQGSASFFSANELSLVSGGLFAHDIGGSGPASGTAYAHDVYTQTDIWNAFATNPLNPSGRTYPWDYFGYHFYLNQGSAVSISELNAFFNQNAGGHDNDGIHREQLNHGDTAPILVTEFGWTTQGVGPQLKADNLADTYDWLRTQPAVAGAMWYQYNCCDPNGDWGLTNGIGNYQPAWFEFAAQTGIASPPVANFSASPTAGATPLAVSFAATGSGIATAWDWDFGDGNTSGLENPQHTYLAAGTYDVALTVTGPGGADTETKLAYITVTDPPGLGDLDEDGDVDLADFSIYTGCFTGSGATAIPAGCAVDSTDTVPAVAGHELAASLANLSAAISPSDALAGLTGIVESGGFHPATPGGAAGGLADLTDGVEGINLEAILADFSRPSLAVRYDLSPPIALERIRVFAANIDGRVFQNYDVAYSVAGDPNFQPLLLDVTTGPFGQANSGSWGASLTEIAGTQPGPLALDVDALRFTFYNVSQTSGEFRDEFDPQEAGDSDGLPQAFEASIIKEIDVIPFTASTQRNRADLDGDGDADAVDLQVLAPLLTGPGN
jgi:PKD repeat protein